MTNADAIAKFYAVLFKFKQKITGKKADGCTKDVEIMLPLKYLSNFRKTLEILLISFEIKPILTWSDKCVLSNNANATTFAITDTKRFVPIVTLSTEDNEKLLEKLKSGFKLEEISTKSISTSTKHIFRFLN